MSGAISVHFSGLRDSELTKLLGWPGYRVYRDEIDERAKILGLWIRRKRGIQKLVCSCCGRKLASAHDVNEREVRDLPSMEFHTMVVVEVYRVPARIVASRSRRRLSRRARRRSVSACGCCWADMGERVRATSGAPVRLGSERGTSNRLALSGAVDGSQTKTGAGANGRGSNPSREEAEVHHGSQQSGQRLTGMVWPEQKKETWTNFSRMN